MKKLYSLLATAMLATVAFAQTTIFNATFDDLSGTGGNDNVWSGNIGVASLGSYTTAGWTFATAGGAAQCIKAGSGNGAGAVTTPELTTLSGNAILTFKAAGYGTDNTKLTVTITGGGTINGTNNFTLVNSSFSDYSVNIAGGTATTKIKIASAGTSKRFFIDDIKVVTTSVLAVNDTKRTAKIFIKNTSIDKKIYFGAKSDIKIFNVNGQIVKAASVSENESLNVENLQSGIYFVIGNINGRAISEKVIKR